MPSFQDRGSVPVPDPTKLTTDAVSSAKADIEKLFDTKLAGFRELVSEQFSGRDTALTAALKSAQELVKQQNDSNTLANDKMEKAFGDQIKNLETRFSELKDTVAARNWPAVGGYIFGACGIAALVIAALEHHGP